MDKKTEKIPLEVIERWLKDEDCDVRTAAMNACQGNNLFFCTGEEAQTY